MNATAPSTGSPFWQTLLLFFGPIALIGLFIYYMMRRAGAGAGGLTNFGRSRARRFEPSTGQPSFDDVAGIDEAKDELVEVVDFLRQPDKYLRLGGRIPHGVLLVGPARHRQDPARARGRRRGGRAVLLDQRPPSSSRCSWASAPARVRDLFAQAKAGAPGIVFIDELDADRPRTRGAGLRRRPRRARADAEPAPGGDGRLRLATTA